MHIPETGNEVLTGAIDQAVAGLAGKTRSAAYSRYPVTRYDDVLIF
jgi:hypothetical protein